MPLILLRSYWLVVIFLQFDWPLISLILSFDFPKIIISFITLSLFLISRNLFHFWRTLHLTILFLISIPRLLSKLKPLYFFSSLKIETTQIQETTTHLHITDLPHLRAAIAHTRHYAVVVRSSESTTRWPSLPKKQYS